MRVNGSREEAVPSHFVGVLLRILFTEGAMPPAIDGDPLLGTPQASRYHKVSPLSSGSFGFVILYETKARDKVAIKFLERGEQARGAAWTVKLSKLSTVGVHETPITCTAALHAPLRQIWILNFGLPCGLTVSRSA